MSNESPKKPSRKKKKDLALPVFDLQGNQPIRCLIDLKGKIYPSMIGLLVIFTAFNWLKFLRHHLRVSNAWRSFLSEVLEAFVHKESLPHSVTVFASGGAISTWLMVKLMYWMRELLSICYSSISDCFESEHQFVVWSLKTHWPSAPTVCQVQCDFDYVQVFAG